MELHHALTQVRKCGDGDCAFCNVGFQAPRGGPGSRHTSFIPQLHLQVQPLQACTHKRTPARAHTCVTAMELSTSASISSSSRSMTSIFSRMHCSAASADVCGRGARRMSEEEGGRMRACTWLLVWQEGRRLSEEEGGRMRACTWLLVWQEGWQQEGNAK